ncbi:hypothetical protein CK203_041642 [Vitis vinifera]|uniref:Uncharacterized protein n=1 Tax=Vitis vinifera TaxID=29760 RepID=A0A438I7N7_VITVI|nr:hypothetical protein CK203_041642 [Vitis vinifera]
MSRATPRKMKAYAIVLIACGSVAVAIVVLCCLCKGGGKRKLPAVQRSTAAPQSAQQTSGRCYSHYFYVTASSGGWNSGGGGGGAVVVVVAAVGAVVVVAAAVENCCSAGLLPSQTDVASYDVIDTKERSSQCGGVYSQDASNANRAGNSQFCSPSGRGHTGPSHGGFGRGNKPICQLYKKIGHVADKCYRRFDISFSGVGSTSYANSSSQANVLSTSNPTDHEWYVDSGATNHVIVDMNNLNIKANYMGNDRSFLLSKILSLLRSNYG